MKKIFCLILILISTKICSFEHFLTVCAIFRDDAPYLKEWIEFHLDQGVEHFYLYNNMSQDNYREVLQPFIDKDIVTLTEWPGEHENEQKWLDIQCASYMDCVNKIRESSRWCAFIDTDEFLFSPKGKLPQIIKRYKEFPGVCANWVLYGTSNIKKIPEGKKIVDYLCWRSEMDFLENRYYKSIVQPRLVQACWCAHLFTFKKHHTVDENKRSIKRSILTKKNSVKYLRINHYRTRDENFFFNVKLPRSKNWNNISREKIDPLNKVYDPILSSSGQDLIHVH